MRWESCLLRCATKPDGPRRLWASLPFNWRSIWSSSSLVNGPLVLRCLPLAALGDSVIACFFGVHAMACYTKFRIGSNGTDLFVHNQEQLDVIADENNGRPRKGSGVRSPLAVYRDLPLSNPEHSTLVH